ncbi:MAG: hypothetical protein F9K48_10850 [Candidatus Brocadia sp.]|nr:MAG: hypothetical protein F9K48_10850 [Candidatus Brocadia sp.]
MNEAKNINAEGRSSKKPLSSQKPQKGKLKPDTQPKSGDDMKTVFSLAKKIDDMISEIEIRPIKSFEKKDQEKLLQSYEKLISKMVREINNSRR